MGLVTIRELRNRGAEVLERVIAGESLTVTRSGKPVAELRPVAKPGLSATSLLERWRRLPPLDEKRLRSDLDRVLDPSL